MAGRLQQAKEEIKLLSVTLLFMICTVCIARYNLSILHSSINDSAAVKEQKIQLIPKNQAIAKKDYKKGGYYIDK